MTPRERHATREADLRIEVDAMPDDAAWLKDRLFTSWSLRESYVADLGEQRGRVDVLEHTVRDQAATIRTLILLLGERSKE